MTHPVGDQPTPPTFALSSATNLARIVPSGLRSEELPRIEFYPDRIVIWRADVDHARPNSIELRLTDIGHVQFLGPGRITIWYGISRPWLKLHTDVKVGRLVAEDRFDQVVAHLESFVPDHLFSIFERTQLRYSRPWNLAEVVPFTDPVASATARVTSTEPLRIEYTTDHHRWSVDHDNGFVLSTAEGTTPAPLLQVLRSQFFQSNGMVIGAMPHFASAAYELAIGEDDSVIVDEPRRGIFIRGERVGTFAGTRGAQDIEFEKPVPEAIALLLMLAQSQRQLLRGVEPTIVDETEEPAFSLLTSPSYRHLRSWLAALFFLGYVLLFFARDVSLGTALGLALPWTLPLAFMIFASRNRAIERAQAFGDRVDLWRNNGNIGVRVRLAPWDIGHMSFARFGTLRIWHGWPNAYKQQFVPLRLGSRRSKGRDELIRHLATMSDTSVCSYEDENGRTVYSRAWTLGELLPWQPHATTATLHPDQGDGAHATSVSGTYPVTRFNGYDLHAPESPVALLARVDGKRIHFNNGMVLGVVQDGRIRFGSGEDVVIDAGDGEVQIDGAPAGRICNEERALRIDLTEPRPELLLLLILLAFAEGTRAAGS